MMSPTKQPTKLPKTAIEILKVLYVDGNNPNSIEIADIFKRRGIEIDSRTVRYHLKQLKNIKLVKNIDKIIFGLYNVMQKENILIFRKEVKT